MIRRHGGRLFAFHRALAARARSKLTIRRIAIEGGKRVLEAGRLKGPPAVLALSLTLVAKGTFSIQKGADGMYPGNFRLLHFDSTPSLTLLPPLLCEEKCKCCHLGARD